MVIRDVVGLILAVGGAATAAVGAGLLFGPGAALLTLGVVMVVLGIILGTGE